MVRFQVKERMSRILLLPLLLAAFVSKGLSSEIWLDDRNVHYISHDYFGTSIGIAKSFLDTLRSCHVIFPNGMMYEAYPNNNIPFTNVFFGESVQPFTSCSIHFRGVGVEFSGTYELLSSVQHTSDNSVSLTRQKFHLTVTLPDFTK